MILLFPKKVLPSKTVFMLWVLKTLFFFTRNTSDSFFYTKKKTKSRRNRESNIQLKTRKNTVCIESKRWRETIRREKKRRKKKKRKFTTKMPPKHLSLKNVTAHCSFCTRLTDQSKIVCKYISKASP